MNSEYAETSPIWAVSKFAADELWPDMCAGTAKLEVNVVVACPVLVPSAEDTEVVIASLGEPIALCRSVLLPTVIVANTALRRMSDVIVMGSAVATTGHSSRAAPTSFPVTLMSTPPGA